MPNEQQQQGFQSFDDFDKFVKQPPQVSPAAQQKPQSSGNFKDFSDFDNFVSPKKEAIKAPEKITPPEKPTPTGPTMGAYKPSTARKLEDWVDSFVRDHRIGTDLQGAFDPETQAKQKSGTEIMLGPVTGVPTAIAGLFRMFTGESKQGEKYPRIAALSEATGGAFTSLGAPGFLSPEALPFYFGLTATGKLADRVSQKLGIPPEFSEAAINVLLLGHQARGMYKNAQLRKVMEEKNVTPESVEQAFQETLEEEKKTSPKPEAIEEIQSRVAGGYPLLKLGEGDQVEHLITRAQVRSRVESFEKQKQDLADHGKKLVSDKLVLPAERQQRLADLDAKTKDLDKQIENEKRRLNKVAAEAKVEAKFEPPSPIKKPFEKEPADIPGRPLSREEREDQWLEERRKRYTDQLAAEREERLRAGEEFKVEDKRRFGDLQPLPGAPAGEETPPPLAEPAKEPVTAALAPIPKAPEQVQAVVEAAAMENMELEHQKASTTDPDALVKIEQRQEENRKLAGDIAQAMEVRKRPKGFKAGTKLTGPVGNLGELKTVTKNYPIRYRVVEGASLKPSHNPVNFEPVEGYPAGVQERDYENDKDAQLAVIQHTQGYDPSFTLSDSPGPEHGPPMVTPDGIVLGGNSRAMSTMRLYNEGGGDVYKSALATRLKNLGINFNEVEGIKEPVLVRELINPPQDIQGMRALGSDMNRVFTRKLSEFEQAVSAGKRLSPATLDYILNQLTELGEKASLRDLLRERPRGILEKLEADGVIAPTERRQFVDEQTNALNDAGKNFVENAILGSVIDDPLVLANAPKGVLQKIERALSSIAKIKGRGEAWDITDYMKEALREHIAAASKGISIKDHIDPPTAFLFSREPIHPIIKGIAEKLGEGNVEVKKAFENYSGDAERDVKDQGTMLFVEPPTPWGSFKDNFGVDVKPQDWGTLRPTVPETPATGETARPLDVPPTPVAPLAPLPTEEKSDLTSQIKEFSDIIRDPKSTQEQIDVAATLRSELREKRRALNRAELESILGNLQGKVREVADKHYRESIPIQDALEKMGEKLTRIPEDLKEAAKEKPRRIEIPEPGPKKKSEFLDEPPPKRTLEESVKTMADEDIRTAGKTLDSQLRRSGITPKARKELEKQAKPFRDEMERRNIADKPERGFGDKNAIFTKERADSARERLRKKLGTTLYSGIDPELVRDVSEIMGYYFEGGIREFGDLTRKVLSEFGDAVRPALQIAYDRMMNQGKYESQTKEQIDLFSPSKRIILPPGVEEARRGTETPREEKPPADASREKSNEGTRSERRETVGQASGEGTRPESRIGEPASGRTVQPTGKGVGGSGVVERFEQPLRNVTTPKIDVPHITDIPQTIDSAEWKRSLKDANLPETLPPPTETLSPEVDEKLAFKGQPEIVRTVLTSLRKYHGAILATSTGTGKTYMGSAVLAETRPRFGLIVTPSKNIAQQWIDTAKTFGVEVKHLEKDLPTEPGIYTTTYSTGTNRKGLDAMPWNMVIADESHFARRWHDESNKRGKFIVNLGKSAENVLYTSATPFHTPLELGYFEKLGLWSKTGLDTWLRNEFGVRQTPDGKYVVPMNYRKLAALREELISRGMFVNLDRDMRGYTPNFSVVPMTPETMDGVRGATKAFRMAEEYFRSKNLNKMIMAVRGNATTFMKSYLERQRLPQAIELGKKLENEGWKVIYFTESKKEVGEIYDFLKPADEAYAGAISKNLPKLPNVVETLQEAFGDDLANFTGAHSGKRQGDLEAFNKGEKKHLVATYGAGGVGVSLHDTSEGGKAPRAIIYLGPPWSGVMFDQAIGRPWRFGTNSNVQAYFLTSNAQPEMRLIFQKVLPRFESLKASVSGIDKKDPIVTAMKDLDSYLAYEFGNETKVGFDAFMNTVDTKAVSSYKEVPIVSADSAKGKGMQVVRRVFKELVHGESGEFDPSRLFGMKKPSRESDIPEDLSTIESSPTDQYEKSLDALRRMFVPASAKADVTDPRLLDRLNSENMAALGIDEGQKPPLPPREVIGTKQIPRPGESDVRQEDLAAPKIMARVYDFAESHFAEWGVPNDLISGLADIETNFRLKHAMRRTAPAVLREFPQTVGIVDGVYTAEKNYLRDKANKEYERALIFKKYDLTNDNIGLRKADQALRLIPQNVSTMALLGKPSKWLDGSVFTENELRAAQEIRNTQYEPTIQDVRAVRPDVGYLQNYSAVVTLKQMEDLTSTLHPALEGKIPADLVPDFSLEIQTGLTRAPFSPHTLKRRGQPPKTYRLDEVLDAYMSGMLKVKHYTTLERKTTRLLAEIPDLENGKKSLLKEYASKYSRIFFGVPSEYARMDEVGYRASKRITQALYSGALEMNPGWFGMHLTKVPVNTWPELGRHGAKYIAKGYGRMMTEDGRELVARSGILMDKLWVFPDTMTELKKKPSGWLRLTTSMSDAIDRSASYLAALEKAKDMGFLGPKEEVGDITWKRLNELAANGVDTEKALDYAHSVIARSEFLYTPGNVQMWQREHPYLGMFRHFMFREMDFISSVRRIAKEVKAQLDPEAYIQKKVEEGHYEYIDSLAKYRRLLISLTGAALAGIGISSRFFPLHIGKLLAPPVAFLVDTVDLVEKTLTGKATEAEWELFAHNLLRMVPYVGGIVGTIDQATGGPDVRKFTKVVKKKHREYEPLPVENFKFDELPK